MVQIKDIASIKEKYYMSEFNENTTNTFATGGNKREEDEDEEEMPRRAVKCQNQ